MATLIHDTDRMSSLEIAELTGKRHDAILRDMMLFYETSGTYLNKEYLPTILWRHPTSSLSQEEDIKNSLASNSLRRGV